MNIDLIIAGLYEVCNYRNQSSNPNSGWGYIWSSSPNSTYSGYAWYVNYCKDKNISARYDTDNCVIPFFKV